MLLSSFLCFCVTISDKIWFNLSCFARLPAKLTDASLSRHLQKYFNTLAIGETYIFKTWPIYYIQYIVIGPELRLRLGDFVSSLCVRPGPCVRACVCVSVCVSVFAGLCKSLVLLFLSLLQREYRKDLEEGVKGKGLTAPEETPELLRAKNATQILSEVGPVLPTNVAFLNPPLGSSSRPPCSQLLSDVPTHRPL